MPLTVIRPIGKNTPILGHRIRFKNFKTWKCLPPYKLKIKNKLKEIGYSFALKKLAIFRRRNDLVDLPNSETNLGPSG